MMRALPALTAAALLAAGPAFAANVKAEIAQATAEGSGAAVGKVTVRDSKKGAVFDFNLRGLTPGAHGLHLHEKASCAPGPGPDGKPVPAGAAGAHWDPGQTGHHLGPEGQGHMGDLPRLEVRADGTFKGKLTAPRLKDAGALKGPSLMIHAGDDNYSDTPGLGGGVARFDCGVLQ